MSYQETKSKNFSIYCRDGKSTLVKKWITDPNVDVNWNYGKPLINAVSGTKEHGSKNIEIIRLILAHPKLKTNYESRHEIKGSSIPVSSTNLEGDGLEGYISCVLNPITQAMILKNFEVLDIFSKEYPEKFNFNRTEYLDVLAQANDKELTNYFMKIRGFLDIFYSCDEAYKVLMPKGFEFFMF